MPIIVPFKAVDLFVSILCKARCYIHLRWSCFSFHNIFSSFASYLFEVNWEKAIWGEDRRMCGWQWGFLVILDQPPHQMATKWFKEGHFHSFYLQLFQPTSLLLIFFNCQISTFIHNYDICIVLTHPAALLKGLFLPKLLHGVCHILYKDVHLK